MNAPGAVLYHVGYLMNDRLTNKSAHNIAYRYWKKAQAGTVALVQKRRSYGVFEYWAVPRTDFMKGIKR